MKAGAQQYKMKLMPNALEKDDELNSTDGKIHQQKAIDDARKVQKKFRSAQGYSATLVLCSIKAAQSGGGCNFIDT